MKVICPDEETQFPQCPHGPCLLFSPSTEEATPYFGCSAFREKNKCSYYLPLSKLTDDKLNRCYPWSLESHKILRDEILRNNGKRSLYFCHTCQIPFFYDKNFNEHAKHELLSRFTKEMLIDPTIFFRPLDNDKGQAQYFFDSNALQFFTTTLIDLSVNKIICIGAPRLHCHLRKFYTEINSYLLDLDDRFCYFLADKQYALYNMCNNHFFDSEQRQEFVSFLKCNNKERLLIFTDPPFGCHTEVIAATLNKINKLYCSVNLIPYVPLPIFWVYPYFNEMHIRSQLPALEMSDYKINYTNHNAFTDKSTGRKKGSPVRLFTNVPLEILKLPIIEQYKYCIDCRKYTALENRHCKLCKKCPSKNGSTYKHCTFCNCCVKASFKHCINCRRCTLPEGHVCSKYQHFQQCWICFEVGHIETNCGLWQSYCVAENITHYVDSSVCCICGKQDGHNERTCPYRSHYIEDITFMGETQIKFKFTNE